MLAGDQKTLILAVVFGISVSATAQSSNPSVAQGKSTSTEAPARSKSEPPREHPVILVPAPKTPKSRTSFFCRGGLREFNVSSQNFEVGDTWTGTVGIPRICGGCFFENAPGSYPQVQPNYQEKININVDWGDGSADHQSFTSDHLTQGPLTLSGNGLTGTHKYNSAVTSPAPMKFEIDALCVDLQGQWREYVDNYCSVPNAYGCTTHGAAVGVYLLDPPSNASIARAVIHGQVTQGALSVVLTVDAPPSGTKLTLSSSSPLVLFPQYGGPSTQTSNVFAAPGDHAPSFAIDATKATAGKKFTISVTNTIGGGAPVVTLPYTVQ